MKSMSAYSVVLRAVAQEVSASSLRAVADPGVGLRRAVADEYEVARAHEEVRLAELDASAFALDFAVRSTMKSESPYISILGR